MAQVLHLFERLFRGLGLGLAHDFGCLIAPVPWWTHRIPHNSRCASAPANSGLARLLSVYETGSSSAARRAGKIRSSIASSIRAGCPRTPDPAPPTSWA